LENIKSNIRTWERDCKTLKDYHDLIQKVRNPLVPSYAPLFSTQKEYEILRLLEKASRLGLKFVTEIGTGGGGTTYLLCKVAHADATIITLDVDMPPWRKRLLESYALAGQTVVAVKADSHREDTVARITEFLHGNELDFLFIDGDHSYDGVKQDFFNYSPLVRKGGWIAFHDIVPDYRTRYGIHTNCYAGGVPQFWSKITEDYANFEIIDDPRQDSCGVGILIWEQ